MARACYDPAESVQCVAVQPCHISSLDSHHSPFDRMFKRLEGATGSSSIAFLETHPSTGQRIKVRLE
jgi:hypothetical protein